MDLKEIRRIFYRDGYRLAHEHLDQELTAVNLKRAIASLYQSVDDLLGSFLKRSAREGVSAECRKGCAWCCHQEVFAVSHEFLYLRDYAGQDLSEEQRDKVLDRARQKTLLSRNGSLEEQLKIRVACPFLEAGSCQVYDARPMACRIYLSSSEKSCLRNYKNPDDEKSRPDLFEFPLLAGRMLNEGFVAYLKQVGLQSRELPLEQGYVSMESLGQTMEDWIKGSGASF
ncbi:MAG: YkgJ family cysteine cluster protein [Bacteroidales bacterium]|nr:YkgJ family cysteine cluster protein [Bacteroidales bacterium]